MSKSLLVQLMKFEADGFILGLDRSPYAETKFVSHIYRGTFMEPGDPMCKRGWNRDNGTGYSIWRNNIGRGVCKICLKNALKEFKS